jgi:hypothetical protein
MKRPDFRQWVILLALAFLVGLGSTGCGGFNGTIPISPMMFMQNSAPPAPAGPGTPSLAANDTPAIGQ